MTKKLDYEEVIEMLGLMSSDKKKDILIPRDPAKDPDYGSCKYCEYDSEGGHCTKGFGFAYGSCRYSEGYKCSGYTPEKQSEEAEEEQKAITEFERGQWDIFEAITTADWGKQRFFLEPNGVEVYDRVKADYLKNPKEAYDRYIKELVEKNWE